MTSVTTLQERLRLVRESLNETQKSLSLRLGMSVGTWPNYETGKTSPDFKTLEALVKLGFSAHWIITGEGEMRKEEGASKPVPAPVAKEIQTVEGYPPFVPIIVKSKLIGAMLASEHNNEHPPLKVLADRVVELYMEDYYRYFNGELEIPKTEASVEVIENLRPNRNVTTKAG